MTGTTSRYGMSYPTGDNLVSELPSLMQNMCTSIDTALAQVDDRNNVGGVKPLVRRTLAELRTLQGVTGQTGYVQTGDGAGVYHFTGTQWLPVKLLSRTTAMFTGRRSDNALYVNKSDTATLLTKMSGSSLITLGTNGNGSYVTLPRGIWRVVFHMQVTGFPDQSWVSAGLRLNNATGLLPIGDELAVSGSGYALVHFDTLIEVTSDTGTIQPTISANNSGSMRAPYTLAIVSQ